jgi:hypothetical protein
MIIKVIDAQLKEIWEEEWEKSLIILYHPVARTGNILGVFPS